MIPKVKEWLEQHGFTLEMRAAQAFRDAGFEVRQSAHYSDPESGKSREIDIVAVDPDWRGVVEISLIVECKRSSKPWAMLCSKDALSDYNRLFAFGVLSEEARGELANGVPDVFERLPWLNNSDASAAYSIRQALTDSDVAYTAAMAVAKASTAWLRRQDAARYLFVFPVIVVDAPLLACKLDERGELQVSDVTTGQWLFFAQLPEYFGSCIRVVTLDALPAFALEAKRVAQALRAELAPAEERVVTSWKDR